MYLAKFFHRPPGDDDRELLLCPGQDPCLIGIKMVPDGDHYFREVFSDMAAAIAAFRRAAAELVAQGYVETDHTDYTQRTLLPDPQAKPRWQHDLDDLVLAALGDGVSAQRERIVALQDGPGGREPLYLWLAAHHGHAVGDPRARDLAQAARDAVVSRRAGRQPWYAWSLDPADIESRIYELLARIHLAAGDPAVALADIEDAFEIHPDRSKSILQAEILCAYFPARRDEAFDLAYRYGPDGFELVTAHPAYADYVTRRTSPSAGPGWRWSSSTAPASEADIAAAERTLAHRLPDDYRRFLAERGKTELQLRLATRSADLRFFAPSELARQRDNLAAFILRTDVDNIGEDYFRETYGVSLLDLVPVAKPTQASTCLLVHLGEGERYGWYYRWDHDGAWELDDAQPNLAAALTSLTGGIERRDPLTLLFFGIFIEQG